MGQCQYLQIQNKSQTQLIQSFGYLLRRSLLKTNLSFQLMNFQNPITPGGTVQTSLNLDANRLHLLASSIMKSNNLDEVIAYEQLLHSYESLTQVLACLCQSKEIYFVTSELILRMLKANVNEMKLKISNSLVLMMNQSFNLEEFKQRTIKIYKVIQGTYIQLIANNIDSLQKYQYNQALEIITLSISQLFNISPEENQPHIKLISVLYPQYYQTNHQNDILGFLLNYQPFDSISKELIIPSNIPLYKALLNIMIQVIQMKQNWEDSKYTQSQILVNHRLFKNKFLTQWAQFTVKQAKIIFKIFLQQNTSFFSALVLPDILKLLHRVMIFSYQSPNLRTYEWLKDKFVKYPQYTFPQGILKTVGSDYTFIEILHQVHTKIVKNFHQGKTQSSQNGINNSFPLQSNLNSGLSEQKTALQMCQLILSIYGRRDLQIQPKNFIKNNGTVPANLYINFVKISILSQILQKPQLYFCKWVSQNKNQKIQTYHVKQRHTLYFAIVEIVTQFIIYGNFLIDNKNKISLNETGSILEVEIKQKMKQFLVVMMIFADQFCLKNQCWSVLYGKDQDLETNQIFIDSRHYEITFASKIFQMLFQCHKLLEFKFLDPIKEIQEIRDFYQRYFKITDQFIEKLQKEFTSKISKLNLIDFNLEFSFSKEIINSLPYIKLKENKRVSNFNGQMQALQQNNLNQIYGEMVLNYFEKFDQLIVNLHQSLQQKVLSLNTYQQSISFIFYLSAILIENYLSNPNFYSKSSAPLVRLIKDLLKVTFQFSQQIKAPSMFAFYQQIVAILSQKSLNSKELLDIIFQVQEQAMGIEIASSQNGQNQSSASFIQLTDKNTLQRSLQLVKKLMKRTCQSLTTKDIKQLDAALIVIQKIFKEFHKNSFATQFAYLKEFIQNFLNSPDSLFSQSINLSRKLQLIQISMKFLQIKANEFSLFQNSKIIISLNGIMFQPFRLGKNIQALNNYFLCVQKMIKSYEMNKIFVIDVFFNTIKEFINEINKNYRKLIKQNINFFEASKSLLLTILQVVELFGGQKWGTKHVEEQNDQNQKKQQKLYRSMFDKDNNDLFKQTESLVWQQNDKDNELPLIAEQYFYTWIKELGREEYETQNAGMWTKQKKDLQNRDLISIYAQYLHLTPNGKLPPLPKTLAQEERKKHEAFKLQNEGDKCPDLDDFLPNETRTTRLLIRLYIQNLYRVSNSTLMAIYPSIDYRLEYVRKWWDEVMVRGLRPQINVCFVYEKFVIFGQNCQISESNRLLAELLFKIANYYKDDLDFIEKYVSEPYRIKSVITYSNNGQHIQYMQGNNQNSINTINQQKKNYISRILIYWKYTLQKQM